MVAGRVVLPQRHCRQYTLYRCRDDSKPVLCRLALRAGGTLEVIFNGRLQTFYYSGQPGCGVRQWRGYLREVRRDSAMLKPPPPAVIDGISIIPQRHHFSRSSIQQLHRVIDLILQCCHLIPRNTGNIFLHHVQHGGQLQQPAPVRIKCQPMGKVIAGLVRQMVAFIENINGLFRIR